MDDFSDLDAIGALLPDFSPLPDCIECYFEEDAASMRIPLASLVSTRLRPEGVANAAVLMRAAAAGEVARRGPIEVARREDGRWDVLDGNSTVAVARLSGWALVPGRPREPGC